MFPRSILVFNGACLSTIARKVLVICSYASSARRCSISKFAFLTSDSFSSICYKRVDTPSFSIGDSVIDLVKNVKYLGVQLDSILDWNQHMKVLCSKVSRAIGFLKYAKKFVPKETLIQMYIFVTVAQCWEAG